jgi:hypothetical protein
MNNMKKKMALLWKDVYGAIGYKDEDKLVVSGAETSPGIAVFNHLRLQQENDMVPVKVVAHAMDDTYRTISGSTKSGFGLEMAPYVCGRDNLEDMPDLREGGYRSGQGHLRGPDSMINAIEMQIANYHASEALKQREIFLETTGQWTSP